MSVLLNKYIRFLNLTAMDNEQSATIQLGRVNLLSYNFALFFLYFVLVLFIGLQLGRIAYYRFVVIRRSVLTFKFRHKIMSFQVGFLLQCFMLALLRSIFFLIFDYVSDVNWLYLFIYWYYFPILTDLTAFKVTYQHTIFYLLIASCILWSSSTQTKSGVVHFQTTILYRLARYQYIISFPCNSIYCFGNKI